MKRDDAVSPVIAVILMVAITVVLAAVVYTWVSGMGSGNPPPGTLGLIGSGVEDGNASFSISSATPGMMWSNLKVQVNGNDTAFTHPSGAVSAGQTFKVPAASGDKITIVDVNANAVIATVSVR